MVHSLRSCRVALFVSGLCLATAAAAQTEPSTAPTAPSLAPQSSSQALSGAAQTPPPPASSGSDVDALRRDLDAARREMQEMREEFRAQLAAKEASEGWDAEWTQERRKLEFFTADGYFRVRPDLFHKFDMDRGPDPSGYYLFPHSTQRPNEHTQAGVNMRFRFEPTLNISEEVRIKAQVDALDNVVFGSTPDYGFNRNQYNLFSIFSDNQNPPRSGINAVADSIAIRRVWGEVGTPVGLLRFGRMGAHWGLGMLRNDGNCLNCDWGDTVDRIQLVTEPLPGSGLYITPFIDFNGEGPTSARTGDMGQPYDVSNRDDSQSYSIIIAKRDTDQQARSKLENNQSVFNFGLYFTYRNQGKDPIGYYRPTAGTFQGGGGDVDLGGVFVNRSAQLFIPDLWLKFERKKFLFEVELAATAGNIQNRATDPSRQGDPAFNQSLKVMQFGGVARTEVRLVNEKLKIRGELGFASGDRAPGMGVYQERLSNGPDGNTVRGDIDGRQFACQSTGGCTDGSIRNFRFNRDYRIDLILWREILGTITDAAYFRPSIDYMLADGFHLYAALIYSRAIYAQSTPSGNRFNLGLEINAGASYETEDGFFANLTWGVLFPMSGLNDNITVNAPGLSTPQAIRASFGIRF